MSNSAIYVSASTGVDNESRGLDRTAPLKSIKAGIERAVAKGAGEVAVAIGDYDEVVRLRAGIRATGGYSTDFANRRDLTPEERTGEGDTVEACAKNFTVLRSSQEVCAVIGEALEGGFAAAALANVIVFGGNVAAAAPGGAACAIRLSGSGNAQKPKVVLSNLKVIGGKGSDGAPAKTPTGTRTTGGNAGSGGGKPAQPAKVGDQIIAAGGSDGADGWGDTSRGNRSDENGTNGGLGRPGAPLPAGTAGAGGKSSEDRAGAFTPALLWTASSGGSGRAGPDGAGGGAGGRGGDRLVCWFMGPEVFLRGGWAGRGGAGGPGGLGGEGGHGGGASFGIVARHVALEVSDVAIAIGDGGRGGDGAPGEAGRDGAPGQPGAAGEQNTYGAYTRHAGAGGPGGPGGKGAPGGRGAGGNGGPAIGIALLGDSAITYEGVLDVFGGKAGEGGQGSENGKPGLSETVRNFT